MRKVVQLDSLVQLLSHSDAHECRLLQVAQITQCVIELWEGSQDGLGAHTTDRVGRDVHFVQDLVALKEVSKFNGEIIVKLVAMEVDLRYVSIDNECINQVAADAILHPIVRQVQLDQCLVETEGIGKFLDLLEGQEAEFQIQSC